MIQEFGERLAKFFRTITPDPFVLAIALTATTALLCLILTTSNASEVIQAWHGGIWSLLRFSMQMCLVLVTGHALASAPVVRRLINRAVDLAGSARVAGALVAFIALSTSLFNWGLGLIVGALLARQMGHRCKERGIVVHYPLLAAAGYTGLMIWHGGLSGSAPLKVTTNKDLVELLGPKMAATVEPVSTFDTIFSTMNLFVSGGLLFLVPLIVYFLMPAPGGSQTIESFPEANEFASESIETPRNFSEKLEQSKWVSAALLVPAIAALFFYYRDNGLGKLNPNIINMTLLTLGIALHGTPKAYVRAVSQAVSGCAGIILQFPLYAGIMGMMKTTGLASLFASWAAGIGSATGYSIVTFFVAGLINFFVPSGGGQWAVQGPIAVQAAAELQIPLSKAVMAVAYGDQWSNMLQPFWALPLLGITGVKARDIIGYTTAVMVFSGVWFILGLFLFT
ncbi:MAG: TIGR00366 family protein [Myxococcota bacterium]|nr:TIGR00366 family protein [Myxococcota bacterium]